MRRGLLIAVILALGVTAAEARHRGHHHHRGYYHYRGYYPDIDVGPADRSGWVAERRGYRHRRGNPDPYGPPDRPRAGAPEERDVAPGSTSGAAPPGAPVVQRRGTSRSFDLVPPDWRLEPPDPNWNGKRFTSPDGAAWFATYAAPADGEPLAAHMKAVTFADGEEITYLRGEAGWIAVSGRKSERIFYRKAVLACGGKVWRHVAFEYPAGAKRDMDAFVNRAAGTLDRSAEDGCEAPASSSR